MKGLFVVRAPVSFLVRNCNVWQENRRSRSLATPAPPGFTGFTASVTDECQTLSWIKEACGV